MSSPFSGAVVFLPPLGILTGLKDVSRQGNVVSGIVPRFKIPNSPEPFVQAIFHIAVPPFASVYNTPVKVTIHNGFVVEIEFPKGIKEGRDSFPHAITWRISDINSTQGITAP